MDLEKQVENNTMNIQKMNDVLRQLIQLSGSHTEQIEKMLFGIDELRGANKEMQEKVDMLIDAQIRNEDSTRELKDEMKSLAKIVGNAHQRINKIEQK